MKRLVRRSALSSGVVVSRATQVSGWEVSHSTFRSLATEPDKPATKIKKVPTKKKEGGEETDTDKRAKEKKVWLEEELWKTRPTPIIFELTEKQYQEDKEFMRKYALLRLKQHRLMLGWENKRKRLMHEAVNSLPPELREDALIRDFSPLPAEYIIDPPYNRPIPNFHAILAERQKPKEED